MASSHCFNCKGCGHLARDCPAQVSIKTEPVNDPVLLSNSNIQYVDEDELEEDFLYTGSIELRCIDFSLDCPFVDNGLNFLRTDRGNLLNSWRANLPKAHEFANVKLNTHYGGEPVTPMFLAEHLNEVLTCVNKDIETSSKPSKIIQKNRDIMDALKDHFVHTGHEEQKEGGNSRQTHIQIMHTSNYVSSMPLNQDTLETVGNQNELIMEMNADPEGMLLNTSNTHHTLPNLI